MNYTNIMAEVKKGQVRSLYLLYGEESYLIRQMEQTIVKALLNPDEMDMNLTVLDKDPTINDLVERIETVPFMGGKNVIAVRDTAFFRAKKTGTKEEDSEESNERLLSILANMPDYSHVIFSSSEKVDKRRKVYKQLEKYGAAIELSYLKAKDVRGWLLEELSAKKRNMSGDGMEYFLSIVSLMSQISLGFLTNELEKVILFSTGRQTITKEDLMATLASLPEVSVFAMIEALGQKQVGKTIRLLEEQLATGEHPLKLIALLSRQVRLMWRAKTLADTGMGSRYIAEELGLAPFIAEKTLKQAQGFSIEKLKNALLALAQADYEFKSGRSSCITLEKIVLDLCRSS